MNQFLFNKFAINYVYLSETRIGIELQQRSFRLLNSD